MRVTGAILLGGTSRRMGTPKELLTVDGETILSRTIRVLGGVCDDVILASGGREPPDSALRSVPDLYPASGPLAGLHAALAHAEDVVFLAACDLPRLNAEAMRTILAALGNADAAVPVVNGTRQPLAAAYRIGNRPTVERHLQDRRLSMRELLDALRVKDVAIDPAVLVNVNTWEEYQQSLKPTDGVRGETPQT